MEKTAALLPVTVKGGNFMIGDSIVQFKGICLVDPGELIVLGHWGEEYIRQVSLWEPDIVRFPVHPKHLNRLGKEKYLEELGKGVDWAKKYGMYSIIDWHIIGNMKETRWQASMYHTTMEQTIDFWVSVAREYANEPAVAFYELYNEPTDYNGELGTLSWEELTSIYGVLLDTIRVYDQAKVALLGGLNWSYDLTGIHEYDPEFENVAYVSHPYPQKSPEPWPENWDNYFGFVTDKYPVFATEFGFCYEHQEGAHIPVISDEHYGDAILNYFNDKNISYSPWVYSWHWYPTLLKDSTYVPSEGQGEYFYRRFTNQH